MKPRFFLLRIFFGILLAAVIMRLFSLQVLSNGFYRNLAENQHEIIKTLVPERGEIFIRTPSGELSSVVTNIEKELVYAVPPEITDKEKTAAALAGVLEMPKQEVLEKITDEGRKWVAIKKQLPESVVAAVKNLDLSGIYLAAETYRFYPEHIFASQALGFLGFDADRRIGRYGIEQYFEEQLRGRVGSLFEITGIGRRQEAAADGQDLVLTLDRAVQFKAEQVLRDVVERHEAEAGSLVVLDPKTGAVLALANFPSFDPNEFNKVEDPAIYRNRVTSDSYEPGSVFKPITMAAALEAEVVTPDLTYEDTGVVAIDKYLIKNSDGKAHGVQTMTQVLEKSLNTGAVFVQDLLGPEKFLDTIRKFGFGAATGITLPAEAPGDIGNLIGGGDIHYATASFGQGITATVLQLAQAFAAIANQGKMSKPYLVEGFAEPEKQVQVISSKTANTLAAMLVSVVERGHGKRAGVPGFYVAGKTGTAQVAKIDEEGYEQDRTVGTFAGFAPVENPVFVAVVRIDNPKGVRFAESTAAPAFGELARFLLNYYQVKPTR